MGTFTVPKGVGCLQGVVCSSILRYSVPSSVRKGAADFFSFLGTNNLHPRKTENSTFSVMLHFLFSGYPPGTGGYPLGTGGGTQGYPLPCM